MQLAKERPFFCITENFCERRASATPFNQMKRMS
jgi:hypothetical protein